MIKSRSELKSIINTSYPTCEIGVAEGLFSKEILSWGNEIHFMVDLWGHVPGHKSMLNEPQELHDSNYNNVKAITEEHGGRRIFLKGMSVDISKSFEDETLGFVYIDACHAYECVLEDLEAWVPKVIKNGIVAGHDFLNKDYGVHEAVKDYCKKHGYKWFLIPEQSKENAGFWFRKTH